MDSTTAASIRDTFQASAEGRLHFGQVVGRLIDAGVDSYAVDYRANRITSHLGTDGVVEVDLAPVDAAIARAFDVDAIKAAIRGAQQGVVMYPEFKRLSRLAGCVGYVVWISGRHVTYFGRNGETHVERFPD